MHPASAFCADRFAIVLGIRRSNLKIGRLVRQSFVENNRPILKLERPPPTSKRSDPHKAMPDLNLLRPLLLPIDLAETLLWHWWQFALLAPGIQSVIDHESRQFGKQPAPNLAGSTENPGISQHQSSELHRESLGPGQIAPHRNLLSPGQQLGMEIDLDRTDVRTRSAQTARERKAVVSGCIA